MAAIGLDALGRLHGRATERAPAGGVGRPGDRGRRAAALRVARRALRARARPDLARLIYGRNPFPESVPIARYLREHTAPGDRVAVVGSEPQIYFYAGRRSATGYIYTYPLMELQPYATAMQQAMIREIESADPRYVVFVRAVGSWLVRRELGQDDLRMVRAVSAEPQAGRGGRHPVAAGDRVPMGRRRGHLRPALRRVADDFRAGEEAMIGEGLTYEQHAIGATYRTLNRTVSETDIVSFVNLCGFTEPLFMDMEYIARESIFKRRAAPGALTFALSEGLIMQTGLIHGTGMAYLGGGAAHRGAGPRGRHAHRARGGRRQARDEEDRPGNRHLPPPRPEPARRAGAGGTRPAHDSPHRHTEAWMPRARARAARSRTIEGRGPTLATEAGGERTNRTDQRLAGRRPEDGGGHGAGDHAWGSRATDTATGSTTADRSVPYASTPWRRSTKLRAEGHAIVPGAIGENVTVQGWTGRPSFRVPPASR